MIDEMDDFNIYDDLQLLQEQGKQKAEEDFQWKQKYNIALGTVEKLQAEKKELSKKIKTLEMNFASLLDTARSEIRRKDNQIAELRKEKDDLCFRRIVRPGFKHSIDNTPRIVIKEHANQAKSVYEKNPIMRSEEKKGDRPHQNCNAIQKEFSDGLAISSDKYEESKCQNSSHNKNRNSVFLNGNELPKQETLKKSAMKDFKSGNLAAPTPNDETLKSEKNAKCRKVLEEDILNDLKEFKQKKQCDLKTKSESESNLALEVVNEKSMLFDALFDDLIMNKENSEDTYSDSESHQTNEVFEVEESKKQNGGIGKSTVEKILPASKMPNDGNLLYDFLNANSKRCVAKIGLSESGKEHEKLEQISISDAAIIINNSIGSNEEIKSPSEVKNCNNGKEKLKNVHIEKICLLEKHPIVSNAKKVCLVTAERFAEDNIEKKIQSAECVRKTESSHKKDNACKKADQKNLKIERGGQSQSLDCTLELSESEVENSFGHNARIKRNSHSHENELSEKNRSNHSLNTQCKCRTPLKSESDLQSDEIKKTSKESLIEEQEDTNIVLKRMKNDNEKLQKPLDEKQLELNSSLNFDEGATNIKPNVVEKHMTVSNSVKSVPIINYVCDLEKKRITNNFAMEAQEQINDVYRQIDNIKTKHCSLNDTLKPVENIDMHAVALGTELDNKFSANHVLDLEAHKIWNAADARFKDDQKMKEGHFWKKTDLDVRKNEIFKDEGFNVDTILLHSINSEKKINDKSISKHIQLINNSDASLIRSSNDLHKSTNLSDLATPIEQDANYVEGNNADECTNKTLLGNDSGEHQMCVVKALHSTTENLTVHGSVTRLNRMNESNTIKLTKETSVESDIEESEYAEMPSLLVEEEFGNVASTEKFVKTPISSEVQNTSDHKILTTENRIHHKKRILQSSRTAQNTKNSLCTQSDIDIVSLSSAWDTNVQESVPSTNCKNLNNTNTNNKDSHLLSSCTKHSLLKQSPRNEHVLKSVGKCDNIERYKKKMLQKYENSNKIFEKNLQNDVSISTSPNTKSNTPLPFLSSKNNNNNTDLFLRKTTEIKIDKDNSSMSKKSTDTLCKSRVIKKCEKRKSSFSTESETSSCSKILKSQKNSENEILSSSDTVLISNPKTNIPDHSVLPLATTTGLSVQNITEVVIPADTSSKNHFRMEQSNEVSSRTLTTTKSKESNNAANLPLDKYYTNESQKAVPLKRKIQLVNKPYEKKIKRRLSSDLFDQNESNSPDKLKSLPSNKNQTKKTESKTGIKSLSVEKYPVREINRNLIDENIFTNDNYPNVKNLPAICTDNDIQYKEIDDRLRSMFQSPTYKSPTIENMIDAKCDNLSEENNHKLLNKNENSHCDTSSSSRKISVGSNDYVIETVDAHVANVFVTRKKCKKRTKLVVTAV